MVLKENEESQDLSTMLQGPRMLQRSEYMILDLTSLTKTVRFQRSEKSFIIVVLLFSLEKSWCGCCERRSHCMRKFGYRSRG